MFNSRYKKEALKECEEAGNKYKGEYEDAIKKSTELHEDKESGVEILKKLMNTYIHYQIDLKKLKRWRRKF